MMLAHRGANSKSSGNLKKYEIDAFAPNVKITHGQLKSGGETLRCEKIEVNNFYISIKNKPVIPFTGEFYFSRYPHGYWDEAIKNMKARSYPLSNFAGKI